MLKPSSKLRTNYKGKEFAATVTAEGKIEFQGKLFDSPSMAGYPIARRAVNGWWFWKYKNKDGNWVRLDKLRK
jgi:hypothetical protein